MDLRATPFMFAFVVSAALLAPAALAAAPQADPALDQLASGTAAIDVYHIEHGGPLEFEQFLYSLFQSMDDVTRAPCASLRLVPSDSQLDAYPYLGEQSTGVELNGGVDAVGTNLIIVTYPTSCLLWAKEHLTGNPNDGNPLLDELLP